MELEVVLAVGSATIDDMTWAGIHGEGRYLGALPESKRRFVQSRVRGSESFGDVVSELFWWGWLRQRNPVDIEERDGLPDLRIAVPPGVTWAEVKRIHLGTQATRAKKLAEKANNQIKRADPTCSGALLIYVERSGARASFDDRVPSDVMPFVEEAKAALAPGDFRSVGQVVIAWDDYLILADPDVPALYTVRRRSLTLDHPSPHQPPRVPSSFWDVGLTVPLWASRITGIPRLVPAIEGGNVVVSQQFRVNNEFGDGMRPSHALEVIAQPDGMVSFELGGTRMTLVTRLVASGKKPYVALVVAMGRTNDKQQVLEGFKVRESQEELGVMAADPVMALENIIRKFGVPIRVGRQLGLFIPYEFVPQGVSLMSGYRQSERGSVSAVVTPVTEPHPGAEVRWAFQIDRDAYYRSLR
jgi:hypothetical protein